MSHRSVLISFLFSSFMLPKSHSSQSDKSQTEIWAFVKAKGGEGQNGSLTWYVAGISSIIVCSWLLMVASSPEGLTGFQSSLTHELHRLAHLLEVWIEYTLDFWLKFSTGLIGLLTIVAQNQQAMARFGRPKSQDLPRKDCSLRLYELNPAKGHFLGARYVFSSSSY